MMKESGCGLYLHLPVGTKENHENAQVRTVDGPAKIRNGTYGMKEALQFEAM
jgi:hypothetical protein